MSRADINKVLFGNTKVPRAPAELTQTEALVFAIRYWITLNSISIWKLNRALEFTDNRLRDLMSAQWNPTFQTLVAIEKLIIQRGLSGPALEALRQPRSQLARMRS
mgnify:CR=1 FL=1